MLYAYADESGHAADPRCDHVGLAGLIASEDAWQQFRERWIAILRTGSVQALHMRELAHRRGEFHGWSESQRRDLLGGCLDAIIDLQPTIVGSVISMKAWRRLSDEDQSLFVDPYFACVQEFVHLADIHGDTVGQDNVAVVLSRNSEFAGRSRSLHDVLLHSKRMSGRISSITYEDMRTEVALQAADLVASEVVLAHDQVAKGSTQVRFPFRRLEDADFLFVRYIDEAYLSRQVAGARGFLL